MLCTDVLCMVIVNDVSPLYVLLPDKAEKVNSASQADEINKKTEKWKSSSANMSSRRASND